MNNATRQRLMFVFLCFVWGSTWIAMKQGPLHVPPAMFAGTRWATAGAIQLFYVWWDTGRLRLPIQSLKSIFIISILVNSSTQIFMLYGLRHVGAGIGAVINSGLTPLSLLAFAVAMKHERINLRVSLAMGLGVSGILVLFGPAAAAGELSPSTLLGAGLVMMGTFTYCGGSVMLRPLTQAHSPIVVAGMINVMGGMTLIPISLIFEPGAIHSLNLEWGWVSWASWLFLLIPASLAASTIFMILVRDWGPSRAGSFAFVSPIIAVFEGIAMNGEALTWIEAIGMTLMLAGAWFALRKT